MIHPAGLEMNCSFSLQDSSLCLLLLHNKLHSQVTRHQDSKYCKFSLNIKKAHATGKYFKKKETTAVLHIKCHCY